MGDGCEKCNGGVFDVVGCPQDFCRKSVATVEMIDLFQKGLPPIAGGVLEQSASFVNAVKYFTREEQNAKHAE